MNEYKVQPLDLMQYINTKYHEPFIHELIEFESKPDVVKLAGAIDKLINIFPILKCRYDAATNSFIENEIAGKGILKIADNADRETLLTQSLDMGEKLIQFTISRSFLVVTVSHLVCDGVGFKNLIYLLCGLYNGKDGDDYTYLMNREFSQVTHELKKSSGMTLKMLMNMLGGYKNKQVYEKVENESVFLVERTLSAEVMSKVHSAAKKQGATLNDVFLTAYARAISGLYDREKINIPCTVDLRKYTSRPTGIANLTGTYNLNVKIETHKSFAESLQDVSGKMQKQKKTKNDIAGPMLLVAKYEKSPLEKFLKLYVGMNTNAVTDYTNLGKIDETKLTFDGATVKRAVGYSGLNKAPCFQIALSSYKGETTVSSMFVCGTDEKKKVERLMDELVGELKTFAKII